MYATMTFANLALNYYFMVMATSIALHGTMADAVITGHPSSVVAALNSNVTFTCSGYQYIIWKVNALQIASVDAQVAVNAVGIFANIDDQNSSHLFMLASLMNNNTEIRCFIRAERNGFLSSMRSEAAYLFVYGAPSPPSNLMISQSRLDLHLSWEAPFSLEEVNITYIVRATNTRSRESRELESITPQLVFNESIGQRDCSLYEFRVYSVNPFGQSNTSIHHTIRIPTEPLVLQSINVFVEVSLENGLSVTLSFLAPNPCSSYHVNSYNVTFTDQTKSGLNSSASFSVPYWSNFDTILLTVDDQTTGIEPDKVYLVKIKARSDAGSMISQPVDVYTTGLQSSSVVLEVNDTASVTCNFALGSDALGCEVSFYASSMSDSMELLFTKNITREPSSNTVIEHISLTGQLEGRAMNITVLTAEWLAEGSVSSIHIQSEVIKNSIDKPDTNTVPPVHNQTTEQALSAVIQPTIRSNYAVYTVTGSILGSLVVLLLLCVTVVVIVIIIVMRKRRGSVLNDGHDRKDEGSDDIRSSNSYFSKHASNSSPSAFSLPEDYDPHYSVIVECRSVAVCEASDPYVLMQSASGTERRLMATNPMYADGIDRDKEFHDPTYEEIKPKQVKANITAAQGPVVYDEVKHDPDGVKLRGNECYSFVETANT